MQSLTKPLAFGSLLTILSATSALAGANAENPAYCQTHCYTYPQEQCLPTCPDQPQATQSQATQPQALMVPPPPPVYAPPQQQTTYQQPVQPSYQTAQAQPQTYTQPQRYAPPSRYQAPVRQVPSQQPYQPARYQQNYQAPQPAQSYQQQAVAQQQQQSFGGTPDVSGLTPLTPASPTPMSPPPASYGALAPAGGYAASRQQQQPKPLYAGVKLSLGSLENIEGSERLTPTITDHAKVTFDTGYGLGVIAGVKPHPNFRVEGEANYHDFDADSAVVTRQVNGVPVTQTAVPGDLGFEAWSVMANGYFDLPIPAAPQIAPYAGLGVGGMFQRNGAEENSFAYQGMLGVNYAFNNDETVAGIGYKYFVAPDILDSDLLHFDAEMHTVEFTVRQHF